MTVYAEATIGNATTRLEWLEEEERLIKSHPYRVTLDFEDGSESGDEVLMPDNFERALKVFRNNEEEALLRASQSDLERANR